MIFTDSGYGSKDKNLTIFIVIPSIVTVIPGSTLLIRSPIKK
jgi:hypothetical protein